MTLSDFSNYSELYGNITLLIASLGMAAVSIPAAIRAIKINTDRPKLLVYVCLVIASVYLAVVFEWSSSSVTVSLSSHGVPLDFSFWPALTFVITNIYLVKFTNSK